MGPQRFLAVSSLVRNARRAYNLPELNDIDATVESWQGILGDVPDAELWASFQDAAAAKNDGYMPSASEIAKAYRRRVQTERDATQSSLQTTWHVQMHMRSEAEENRRIAAFQASERARRIAAAEREQFFQDLKDRGQLDYTLPPRPEVLANILPSLSGGLKPHSTNPLDNPIYDWNGGDIFDDDSEVSKPDGPAREYSDDELLTLLRDHCNFDDSKIGRETAVAFGRFLLESIRPDLWSAPLAKSQWGKWKDVQRNAVQDGVAQADAKTREVVTV